MKHTASFYSLTGALAILSAYEAIGFLMPTPLSSRAISTLGAKSEYDLDVSDVDFSTSVPTPTKKSKNKPKAEPVAPPKTEEPAEKAKKSKSKGTAEPVAEESAAKTKGKKSKTKEKANPVTEEPKSKANKKGAKSTEKSALPVTKKGVEDKSPAKAKDAPKAAAAPKASPAAGPAFFAATGLGGFAVLRSQLEKGKPARERLQQAGTRAVNTKRKGVNKKPAPARKAPAKKKAAPARKAVANSTAAPSKGPSWPRDTTGGDVLFWGFALLGGSLASISPGPASAPINAPSAAKVANVVVAATNKENKAPPKPEAPSVVNSVTPAKAEPKNEEPKQAAEPTKEAPKKAAEPKEAAKPKKEDPKKKEQPKKTVAKTTDKAEPLSISPSVAGGAVALVGAAGFLASRDEGDGEEATDVKKEEDKATTNDAEKKPEEGEAKDGDVDGEESAGEDGGDKDRSDGLEDKGGDDEEDAEKE